MSKKRSTEETRVFGLRKLSTVPEVTEITLLPEERVVQSFFARFVSRLAACQTRAGLLNGPAFLPSLSHYICSSDLEPQGSLASARRGAGESLQ